MSSTTTVNEDIFESSLCRGGGGGSREELDGRAEPTRIYNCMDIGSAMPHSVHMIINYAGLSGLGDCGLDNINSTTGNLRIRDGEFSSARAPLSTLDTLGKANLCRQIDIKTDIRARFSYRSDRRLYLYSEPVLRSSNVTSRCSTDGHPRD